MITSPALSLRIFASQEQVLKDAASEKPQCFVRQHDRVAWLEAWLVFGAVDVA